MPEFFEFMKKGTLLFFLLLLVCGWGRCEDGDRVFRVGIHDKPPYATKGSDGEWRGIAVDLWNSIAVKTGIRFELVETPYEHILADVASGKLDVAVGEMEVTADSERAVDFTQPYLMSSIGIALQDRAWHPDWVAIAKEFFNWTLVQVLLAIFAGMLLVSVLIWFFERHHQVGHFRGGLSGFGSALWFAAVTMTTVGYGDKTPSTLAGRLVSFFWMLAGVLLIASFTAAVATSVAAARVSEMVTRPGDLYRVRCGVLNGSMPQRYLEKQGIPARPFEDVESALKALSAGQVEAVVADRNSLCYLSRAMTARNPDVRFRVSPVSFQNTFIGLPVHSKLPEFEEINVALLATTSSEEWQEILRDWLGHNHQN